MIKPIVTILIISMLFLACESNLNNAEVTKIAFGSCGHQDHDLPIFNLVADYEPDLFIFLGDNIYGDTYDMNTLRVKYQKLGSKPSYRKMKEKIPILATWDDHDYGANDIGKQYPPKEESKEIFLDFFEEPEASERRSHPGIYHSYMYNYGAYNMQIILLDGRTFRDTLLPYAGHMDQDRRYFYPLDYAPHVDSEMTLLGEQQWKWLESELKKTADLRIIGTGTQFGIEWNGYEAWANFPQEQKKMIDLIKSTKASGVLFISGDVHYSELSKLETDFYPLYDFTSSGLSSTWHFATPNVNRIEGPIMDNHFGMISIEWNKNDPLITMETIDIYNNQRIEFTMPLSTLKFKG